MTIYPNYPQEAREMVQYFLGKYFHRGRNQIKLRKEIKPVIVTNPRKYSKLFKGQLPRRNPQMHSQPHHNPLQLNPLRLQYSNLNNPHHN